MSEGSTWPEQEVIHAWVEKHDIEAKPWEILELAYKVSEHRIKAERELHDKWEVGVRIIQLIEKCGDTVNSRDILQTLNGEEHVDRPYCWCNPVQDDEEPDVWIHKAINKEGE